MSMSPYGNIEISELVTMLVEARNIDEQVANFNNLSNWDSSKKLVCFYEFSYFKKWSSFSEQF